MIKEYYSLRLKDKKMWTAITIPLIYTLILYLFPQFVPTTTSPIWLDLGFKNIGICTRLFFDENILAFFLVPVYIIFIMFSHSYFLNASVIYRMGSIEGLCHKWFLTSLIDAVTFNIYIYVLMLSRVFFFNYTAELNKFSHILITAFLLQIATFFIISIILNALIFATGNSAIGIILILGIILYESHCGLRSDEYFLVSLLTPLAISPASVNAAFHYALSSAAEIAAAIFLLPLLAEKKDFLERRHD